MTIQPVSAGALYAARHGANDNNFSKVVMLSHGESFVNSSSRGAGLVAHGAAAISSVQQKFDNNSLSFPGANSGYMSSGASADYSMGAEDFTIEFWFYSTSAVGATLFELDGNASFRINMTINSSKYLFRYGNSSIYNPSSPVPLANTWTSVAWGRTGTANHFWINGSHVLGTASGSPQDGTNIYLGADVLNAFFTPLNGYIDELRITRGLNRYGSSNYNLATSSFPDS